MKFLTRKFAISILAMVFAVVALGSTTFAWFTMTGKAEVSSLQASARGGDGLEIRLADDPVRTQWTAGYLDLELSDYFKNDIMKNVELAPIHNQGVSGITPTFQKLQQTGRNLTYVGATYSNAERNYIKFTLQFRTIVAGTINLLNTSSMTGISENDNGSFSWTPDQAYKKTVGDTPNQTAIITSSANAARILTIQDTTVTGGLGTVSNVFENPTDAVVGNTDGLNAATDDFGAMGYFKAKTGITNITVTPASGGTTTKLGTTSVGVANLVKPEAGEGTGFFDNANYYYAEIDVYIYMEGWDRECLNALFNGGLKIDLAFAQA